MSARTPRRGLVGHPAALAAGGAVLVAGGGLAAPVAVEDPDVELMRLGALFDHAAAVEAAARTVVEARGDRADYDDPEFVTASRLQREIDAIVDQIETLPASTLPACW